MYKTAKIAARATATLRDPRWTAVLARDTAQDGHFVFAVATTGIYCKPSCTSRRPRPENVRFYATCEDAELAGFRACRRCRPELPSHQTRHAERVAQACRLIEAAAKPLTLEELAQAVGLSRFYFHQLFKSHTGMTPRGYAALVAHGAIQRRAAPEPETTPSLGAAVWFAHDSGWGRDEPLRYCEGRCSLGHVLVGLSECGLCAILLGDEPAALREELAQRLGSAVPGTGADCAEVLAQVIAFIEQPGQGLELPLDLHGTVFQQRVWRALQQIPPGSLVTYAQIAERIGKQGSVRAVANACGANLLAVAIPCHRVVRSDGALSGYRWGVERKRALIERESQQAKGASVSS